MGVFLGLIIISNQCNEALAPLEQREMQSIIFDHEKVLWKTQLRVALKQQIFTEFKKFANLTQ